LVIDASQSLGACPLDLASVQPDFLVAVGYKWLLGPYGLGYLYVAPKWRESGTPFEQSWLTRAGSEDFARLVDYRDEYRPGARRFDMGEFPQFVLVPMAMAALRQLLAWGVSNIQESISRLTGRIADYAGGEGYAVLPPEQRCGHMIGIRHPAGIPSELAGLLRQARVFVSIRGDSIRIAPHLYNDGQDIERLFKVLGGAHVAA
jgi:selenocysteine lyase/cysteine desulfurase